MKKSVLIIAAVALLAALSCTKQEQTQSTADGRIIVTATIENAATKVAFTEGVGEIKGVWEADDHIIGWDADGRAIELAVEKIRDNGAAEFATVSGSAPLPASGKVYMIYAPGKGISDVGNKSLAYDLTTQNGAKVPALMTATGVVAGNRLELRFKNELALVAVKNPSFPVTAETTMRGLKISGDNINTVATFSMNGEDLVMASSNPGALTRNCEFTTTATGASEVMTYFAVLPDSTPADITVSTVEPEGYQNIYTGRSFVKGQCYIMDTQTIDKRKFSITIADGIENGSVTTDPENECGWGDTVTVIPSPSPGYAVDAISYYDGSANYDITSSRLFTMPCADVTVTVTFKESVFSVATDRKVKFTKGNLYWDGDSYEFEACQYDYRHYHSHKDDVAVINGVFGTTPANTVGSFWGVKNTDTDTKPYTEALSSEFPGGQNDVFFTNGTHETPNSNFTANGETGKYRILSMDEWRYLINSRSSTNRFAKAKYKDVSGLLIFPDGYGTVPTDDGIATVNIAKTSYPPENMSDNTWNTLNLTGVVFLPAIGTRYYGSKRVSNAGTGQYWSTTAVDQASSAWYDLKFDNSNIETYVITWREKGCPIRLVYNVQ